MLRSCLDGQPADAGAILAGLYFIGEVVVVDVTGWLGGFNPNRENPPALVVGRFSAIIADQPRKTPLN